MGASSKSYTNDMFTGKTFWQAFEIFWAENCLKYFNAGKTKQDARDDFEHNVQYYEYRNR